MQEMSEFYIGKRVLVTGHTGFMGSWLTKWLTMLNAEVCGYALDPPTQPNIYETLNIKGIVSQDVTGDINNTELLRRTLGEFQHLQGNLIAYKRLRNLRIQTSFDQILFKCFK